MESCRSLLHRRIMIMLLVGFLLFPTFGLSRGYFNSQNHRALERYTARSRTPSVILSQRQRQGYRYMTSATHQEHARQTLIGPNVCGLKCCHGWKIGETPLCITPVCTPKCVNGGHCIRPKVCLCRASYTGAYCATRKRLHSSRTATMNQRKRDPRQTVVNSFGHEPSTESNLEPQVVCTPITCFNEGTCVDGSCICREGYQGRRCEKVVVIQMNMNAGLTNALQTSHSTELELCETLCVNGRCTAGPHPTCQCYPGYSGVTCKQSTYVYAKARRITSNHALSGIKYIVPASIDRGIATYSGRTSYATKYGNCYKSYQGKLCGFSFNKVMTMNTCCDTSLGDGWGPSCTPCPRSSFRRKGQSNTYTRSSTRCPKGFANVYGVCQDINECLTDENMCSHGVCINSRGSYWCKCNTGYHHHISRKQCIPDVTSRLHVPSRSGDICYLSRDSGDDCGKSSHVAYGKKTACCCSVGYAWGSPCNRCPKRGTAEYDDLCPSGSGYVKTVSYAGSPRQRIDKPATQRYDIVTPRVSSLFTSADIEPSQTPQAYEITTQNGNFGIGKTTSKIMSSPTTRPMQTTEETLTLRTGIGEISYPVIREETSSPPPVSIESTKADAEVDTISETTKNRIFTTTTYEDSTTEAPSTDVGDQDILPNDYDIYDQVELEENSYSDFENTEVLDELLDVDPQENEKATTTSNLPEVSSVKLSIQETSIVESSEKRAVDSKNVLLIEFHQDVQEPPSLQADACSPNPCRNDGGCAIGTNLTFQCNCVDGYIGLKCEINACDPNPCSYGSCKFAENGYQCLCEAGYAGKNCDEDVDECLEDVCGPGGTCMNTGGSYKCTCLEGYQLSNNEQSCEDVPECETIGCGDSAICQDMPGSYECVCSDQNYKYDEIKRACISTISDEESRIEIRKSCYSTPHFCTNVLAQNLTQAECCCTIGRSWGDCNSKRACPLEKTLSDAFKDLCPHGRGLGPGEHSKVEDLNECDLIGNNVICRNGKCVNSFGGYRCQCYPGFYYNRRIQACDDINECVSRSRCIGGYCINLKGSYKCHCPAGTQLQTRGFINRCTSAQLRGRRIGLMRHRSQSRRSRSNVRTLSRSSSEDVCFAGTMCSGRLPGKYSYKECCCGRGVAWGSLCSRCPQRHTEDYRFLCHYNHRATHILEPLKRLYSPTQRFVGRGCGAKRECNNGKCLRTARGYTCTCDDGFRVDEDLLTCTDIDECDDELDNVCKNGRCLNQIGSFRCICDAGYESKGRNATVCKPALTGTLKNIDALQTGISIRP